MSGRDHHFIPQLLQKGFSAGRTRAGQHQIWVFRRNKPPFATNTRNSFVEKDFYGPPDDSSIDDMITAEELELDRFLSDARAFTSSQSLQHDARAPLVVWHLGLRARWMRDLLTTFSRVTVDRLRGVVTEQSTRSNMFRAFLARESSWLLETMLSEASKRAGRLLTAEESAQIAELAKHLQAHPEVLAEISKGDEIIRHAEKMQTAAKPATDRAHVHFLQKHFLSRRTGLRQHLGKMMWKLVVSGPSELILGDCGPMTVASSGNPVGPLGTHEFCDWSGIALPISSSRFLFGTLEASGVVPDAAMLNESAAVWSSEAFIARANTAANQNWHGLISSRVQSYMAAEVETAFKENGM